MDIERKIAQYIGTGVECEIIVPNGEFKPDGKRTELFGSNWYEFAKNCPDNVQLLLHPIEELKNDKETCSKLYPLAPNSKTSIRINELITRLSFVDGVDKITVYELDVLTAHKYDVFGLIEEGKAKAI